MTPADAGAVVVAGKFAVRFAAVVAIVFSLAAS
jgi:hypothetical protein